MPRKPRLDYPGALHHVMARGIEGKSIFKSTTDKKAFLSRLRTIQETSSIHLYAWALMDNHVHLLIQTGRTPLSLFMRRLMTSFAIYYNKVYKRKGHLFQNRFKSVLCDQDEYLKRLVCYIHLNPVKAGVTQLEDLGAYPWTSHHELIAHPKDSIVDCDEVLGFFGSKPKEALKTYFLHLSNSLNQKIDLEGGGLLRSLGGLKEALKLKKNQRVNYDDRILGTGKFVDEVLSNHNPTSRPFKDTDEILSYLTKQCRVSKEDILDRSTDRTCEARDLFVYLTHKYLNQSLTSIGKMIGIQTAAASRSRLRGRRLQEERGILAGIK